jgi:hypothetical protein
MRTAPSEPPGWERLLIAGHRKVPRLAVLAALFVVLSPVCGRAATTQWMIAGEPLTIVSEPWFAGAISSLKFRGVEYLDAADHGRLLSSSISFDHWGECLNPTLAGSVADGAKHETSSQLLSLAANAQGYRSETRMAYWMPPGAVHHVDPRSGVVTPDAAQACAAPPAPLSQRTAVNQTVLSDVVYAQNLTPAYAGIAHAILDQIVFTTTGAYIAATVEAVTAYTPKSFDHDYLYDAAQQRFELDGTVAAHPGEQARPVILASTDGRAAIGVMALTREPPPRYGRHIFPNTNKWKLVFRPSGPYPAGAHRYDAILVIGSLEEAQQAMVRAAAAMNDR